MSSTVTTSLGDLRRFTHGLDSMTPFEIYEGESTAGKSGKTLTGDVHFDPQMFIIISGETEFFLDDISFTGRSGDIFISTFWEPHAFRTISERMHFLVVTFSMFALGSASPFADFDWNLFMKQPPAKRKLAFDDEKRGQIIALAQKIIDLKKNTPPGYRSVQWFIFHEIMFSINSAYLNSSAAPASSSNEMRIFPALELIRHNPNQEIPLDTAAASCSMSRSTFCLEFKNTMNESFSQFAMRKRIGYSCMLLRQHKFTIKEISDQCGFKNVTHFYHVFKKFRQCTPLEFISEKFYDRQV